MNQVSLIRKAKDKTRGNQSWVGYVDEAGKLRITYGPIGRAQRTVVVPPKRFTQFNAELELEHRATRKRSEGFCDTIDSVDSPMVAESVDVEQGDDWPALYMQPGSDLMTCEPETIRVERNIAACVEEAFSVNIPGKWPLSARVIARDNVWRMPMLIYVLALAKQDVVKLYDDDEKRISPTSFAKRIGLAERDERANKLICEFGLVSVSEAFELHESLSSNDLESEEAAASIWFF